MDQKLKNYSSGMQVRLAFSMAVRADADILLIDEVLAVGDADFQRKCFEYFNQLKRRKKTVVFVSHDMDAVQKYCDRTMVIDKHKTIHLGDTVEAAEKYLQLFNKTVAGKEGAEEGVKRWGDGSFRTTDISVKVANSSVTVSHKAKLFSEAASLTAGIRVRSSTGQPVTGTSTQLESVTIPDLKVGEEVEITWKMPNIFSDGQYYVDPALASDGGITITDWWDQAARFTVKKKRPLPYQVDPDFDVEVKRK
jgi:ABC-2 type transport system ATP-binding protein